MRTIKISEAVWSVIVQNGRFGEQADDVLRRLLLIAEGSNTKLPATEGASKPPVDGTVQQYGWKERRATVRMTQNVENGKLRLKFDSGVSAEWQLPAKEDLSAIRQIRDEATAFVRKNGGTEGQEHAAIRALTSRGYHVTGKGRRGSEYV